MASVRKTVTVVFCDLVGSTSLGDRSDPEVLQELMQRYHTTLRTMLERHGGTVEKFVGDAAMAVFGIPQVHEDDALRAVRAAVEMRESVAALGLVVRIGVNTGQVMAGGAGETLVTGDAVNVASRLEQAAEGGQIFIGAPTERLVRDAVRVESLQPLALKGKSEAVVAFRVHELVDEEATFTRTTRTPFIGREIELRQLEGELMSALELRSPRLATIVGTPGIGKSRLARQVLAHAPARVLVGRCLPYGEGITYWPLSEIAAQAGDVTALVSDDPLAAKRIHAAFGAESASPEEIAWGFRKLFETLAQERPLIVVFDDVHWAEPTLLDLIEYIATFAKDVPLFLLCTARADLFERRPDWATPKPNTTLLTLEPLAQNETEALIHALGEIPADLSARIAESAGGNPLFVEQLAAMQAEGRGFEIPPTLQALMAARIDRLAPDERAVVECGAIEGRLFHRGTVEELTSALVREGVGAHLLTLVRKELIQPDEATLTGDDGFRFRHVLIRDAAYERIPKRVRAGLHERYANLLAVKLGEDAPSDVLGYHLEQAYRYQAELGSPDAALGEQAAERLAYAGRSARMRGDVRASANLFGRAADLLSDNAPRRARLLVDLGEMLAAGGDLEHGEAVLAEAVRRAQLLRDPHVEWLARIRLAFRQQQRGFEHAREKTLIAEAEGAIAALEPQRDHEVLTSAWRLVALVNWRNGRVEEQERALERALASARTAGDLELELGVFLDRTNTVVHGPVPVEDGLRWVGDVESRAGDSVEAQNAMDHALVHLLPRVGRFDEAHATAARWRERMRELGFVLGVAGSAACVWEIFYWAEDWENAERDLRQSFEALERIGHARRAEIAANLGEALLRRDRLDEAERYALINQELMPGDDHGRMLSARLLAERGRFEKAESVARAAIESIAKTEFDDVRANLWLRFAEILRKTGSGEAESAARTALALFEQKGITMGVARAKTLLR